MAARDGEAPARWWPAWLLLAGVSTLLPQPAVRRTLASLEEALLSVRRIVDPGAWSVRVAQADDSPDAPAGDGTPPGAIDPAVADLLQKAHARVLPPRAEGWQRDGRFCAVAVGRMRSPALLALAIASLPPPGEPAFHGRELVGFTPAASDRSRASELPHVVPVRAKGTRIPALAGRPGQREVRFLALGDGSELLRVTYAGDELAIQEGDLAWALDSADADGSDVAAARAGGAAARTIGGAWLGRIVRGDGPAGAERVDWRIAPITPLQSLAEVALRYPPGFPAPAELTLVPLEVGGRFGALIDSRRGGLLVDAGREEGVEAGAALSDGGNFLGRIVRAGWQQAVARTLRDPGLRCRVLILRGSEAIAWELATAGVDGEDVLLVRAPPMDDGDGALVVTAASPEGIPEGLVVGRLVLNGRDARLRPEPTAVAPLRVWRAPGSWSSGE